VTGPVTANFKYDGDSKRVRAAFHSIRSEGDLNRHLDYLHFNPVKHGLVKRPADWPWSSFHRFVKMGYYEKDWGADLSQQVLDLECGE